MAEVNGEAFLLLRKRGKIREFLNLKVGSWVVLEHELFLHFGQIENVESDTSGGMSADKTCQLTSRPERSVVEGNEVDTEPRYSLCEGEILKAGFKCFGRGREQVAPCIRRESQTYAMVEVTREMENYLKYRLSWLDEERGKQDLYSYSVQVMDKQDYLKHLYHKLSRMLCANKKILDYSLYPILVLSKPDASMNQEFLEKTFLSIQNVQWQVIIDFDDQSSESKGLFTVFKSGPESPQCDVHESEDYVDDAIRESIGYKTHWIFANGFSKLNKKAMGFKKWFSSKRNRGLSRAMGNLEKMIPDMRAVVLFLLFSNDYEPMAHVFNDCSTYFGGSNQLVYVAENSDIVKNWDAKLLSTCLEEHELRERGVVGMSWSEFQECVQQMVSEIDRCQRYVSMANGSSYPLSLSFNNIDVVSAKECEELHNFSFEERLQLSSKVEIDFHRGHPVTWPIFGSQIPLL